MYRLAYTLILINVGVSKYFVVHCMRSVSAKKNDRYCSDSVQSKPFLFCSECEVNENNDNAYCYIVGCGHRTILLLYILFLSITETGKRAGLRLQYIIFLSISHLTKLVFGIEK